MQFVVLNPISYPYKGPVWQSHTKLVKVVIKNCHFTSCGHHKAVSNTDDGHVNGPLILSY